MQTIIIADSHNLCREALCRYIRQANPDIAVDDAGSYQELLYKLQNSPRDLILIDADLPGWEGDGGVEKRLMLPEPAKVGVMLPLRYPELPWKSDVQGVFPKSLTCKAFLGGIHDILEGGTFFPAVRDHFEYHSETGMVAKHSNFQLTGREKEVLSYLVKGASNKDIARALDLQVVTVKLHVRGICRKMKAANRTQAALMAKENGWG